MAKIILVSGESFEHYHGEESITLLEKGKARFTCLNISKELRLGEAVTIPPNVSHILENIGDTECILDCSHGAPPGK